MAEKAAVDLGKLRANASIVPAIVAPVLAVGFMAVALFGPIVGVQATELARLVQDAEIDLRVLLSSQNGEVLGTLKELQSKFLIFNILVTVWLLVANTVIFSLTEGVTSRRWRYALTITLSSALPTVITTKYLLANWATSRQRQLRGHSFFEHWIFSKLPAFEPGGLWLFVLVLVVQTLVIQVLWVLYCRRRAEIKAEQTIPLLFWSSLTVFVICALAFRFGSTLLATLVGTINLILLYVTIMCVVIAGVLFYLRSSMGRTVASAFLLYVCAVTIAGLYFGTPPKSNFAAGKPASIASNGDQFKEWLKYRPKPADPERPIPVFIVAASGGGMRATIRTVAFLDHMQTVCPDFLRHTFAISGVSGGALGTLLYAAQQQLQQGQIAGCDFKAPAQANLVRSEDIFPTAPLIEQFLATDVLPAIVGPGLFTETLMRLVPPGLFAQFDRSVSFNELLAASWHEAVKNYKGKHGFTEPAGRKCAIENFFASCDSKSYWDASKNMPLLIFNATSATDGGLVPLSNIDQSYFPELPLSRGIYRGDGSPPPFLFDLLTAASASARFPVALPAASLAGVDGYTHTLVDGAYFDNSGLVVAHAVKKRIQQIAQEAQKEFAATPKVRVIIVYLRERDNKKSACENAAAWVSAATGETPQAPRSGDVTNGDLAHVSAVLRSRDMRDQWNEILIGELDKGSIIGYDWDLYIPQEGDGAADLASATSGRPDCSKFKEVSPLAFYYAPTTRHEFSLFLKSELDNEDNTKSSEKIRSLLRPTGN